MTGLYALAKSEGPTSNACISKVRRASGVKRVGHSGTLDPMATGVLVVAVGVATRLLRYCVGWDKGYRARILFGLVTDTDDVTGSLVARCDASHLTRAEIESAMEAFVGEITQVPPRYSALKIEGRRSYARAREGEEFKVAARRVRVDALRLCGPETVSNGADGSFCDLEVECASGTYIRSIARDLGQALGVGGTLARLHRYRVGSVSDSMACEVQDWDPSQQLDVKEIFPGWSWRTLSVGSEWDRLKVGATLSWQGEPAGRVGILSGEPCDADFPLKGVYRSEGESLVPEMVFVTQGDK